MQRPLVGRESEIDALTRFISSRELNVGVLVIDGEPGIGKSTLWELAVARASSAGARVLQARPTEAEADLPLSVLGDLLEGMVDDLPRDLPEPQRRALDVALLRASPLARPPERRAVSVAVATLLRLVASRAPTLVAIDDLHWVDPSSARVLDFALRRVASEPLRVIAAIRTGFEAPVELLRESVRARVARIRLEALTPNELARVVAAHLRSDLPRPVVKRIHAVSGGNPLFALEISRAYLERGSEALDVPSDLTRAMRETVRALPRNVRDLLLPAAALSHPTLPALEAVIAPRSLEKPLAAAEAAGVLERRGEVVRFTHPLLASAIYRDASAERRRAVHRHLAEVVKDAEERARHLALASSGPDAEVARALDEAALSARGRGAADAAAEFADRAVILTPPGIGGVVRRKIAAAEYHFESGDPARARALLEEVIDELPPGLQRADVLHRLAWVRHHHDSLPAATDLFDRAMGEAGEDLPLRGRIQLGRVETALMSGMYGEAAQRAREALDLGDRLRDDTLRAQALMGLGLAEFLLGGADAERYLERAVALEDAVEEWRVAQRPSAFRAVVLTWADRLDEARHLSRELYRQSTERGDDSSLPNILFQWSEVETRAGNWAEADRLAREADEAVRQTGQEPLRAFALYYLALVDACRGRAEEARASAGEGMAVAQRTGWIAVVPLHLSVLGFLELSLGNPAGTHEHLGPIAEALALAVKEPGVTRMLPDEIEALVALGDLEGAKALLGPFGEQALELGRPWALGAAARCRALIAAALGDARGAVLSADDAVEEHERLRQPFELGRTLVVRGSIQRRARQKAAARGSLEAAVEIFERLGAPLWAERARGELARIGGRAPAPTGLTPNEQKVVELVATGRTNRQVAEELFMSVRTVEDHLSKVYRKLGIRSRTELARRIPHA